MPFELIRFQNFRNLENSEIPVRSGQVFFIGENGQGKTNFLEAIYTLCYGKSFRSNVDSPLIRHGCKNAGISGVFDHHGSLSSIKISFGNGKKEILNDQKIIVDRKDLIDRYPCVVFCHEDLEFVRGGPEFQRQFFDQTASLLYPGYLNLLRDYGKTVKARNLLIKDQQYALLSVYNQKMVEFGLQLQEIRKKLIIDFNELFTPIFSQVSGSITDISIKYLPSWEGLNQVSARQRLEDRLPRDIALRTTTSGPHRDKYHFLRGENDFNLSASTGQLRLLSLLLRLAQASLIKKIKNTQPILLLDDVLLELDFQKRKRFLACLPEAEQTFYTFLPDEQVSEYMRGKALCYGVTEGRFNEENW